MEYPIGIEMTKDYLSFEVSKAAYKLVHDVMLAKPGENIVITADSSSDRRVAEAIANAAFTVGGNPVLIYYPTSELAYSEPIAPIGAVVSHADIWIEIAYASIMHCESFRKALDFGCRYINLTGLDVTMLTNCIGKIDYNLQVQLGETIKRIMEEADEILVTDDNGTNLHAYNKGRKVRHSGQFATQKGYPIMMGGQISWSPIEETIEGTLVFDAALFPPTELGMLHENIRLTFKEGVVIGIEGGREAAIFKTWLDSFNDPNMYRMAHYSLGFNPAVTKPTGRIVEDERIFGCMEFGIGSQGKAIMGKFWTAASHTDGIVSKPSIILDGVPFEEKGRYVHPEVVGIIKKMGVAGY